MPSFFTSAHANHFPFRYRVTTLVLVPSLIYQIVHHPRFSSVDFSTVQAIQCGAAYLPVQLSERLRSQIPSVQRIGGGVFPAPYYLNEPHISGLGYGMSECVSGALKLWKCSKLIIHLTDTRCVVNASARHARRPCEECPRINRNAHTGYRSPCDA